MAVALDTLNQPPVQPYRYGLFSAVPVIDDNTFDPRGDYTWRVQGCTPGATWSYCWQDGYAGQNSKNFPQDAWLEQSPFVVYDGVRCSRVGFPDGETVARQRLALSEQGQAERHLWDQLGATATAEGTTAILYDASAPADDLTIAVAALEAQLAATTGAIGVIHAPRATAPHWDRYGELWRDGNVYRTPLGTPIVFGGGYDYDGPDGTATDDVIWLYATGQTIVRRGAVQYHGTPDNQSPQGFNQRSNEISHLAERPYLITVDCPVIAAAVTLTGRPATVWPTVPAPLAMTLDASDPSAVTASFTNATCSKVQITWGDGTTDALPVTTGATSGTHDYTAGTTRTATPATPTPTSSRTRSKKKG